MATPTILFNNATGSDTAASGAGPGTALSGTSASYSGSVFTLDGSPNLSGVATDGTHVIWVATSTGRQFFTINAVDDGADTVTVDDAPAGTTTGLTWGLGGKRKTLDNTNSRKLFSADIKAAWIVELEDDQTITSALTVGVSGSTSGKITIRGDSAAAHRVITQSSNAYHISMTNINYWRLENLKFQNTNGTKTSAVALAMRGLQWECLNCIFGDATNTLLSAGIRTGGSCHVVFNNCEIAHCTDDGLQQNNSAVNWELNACWVHDCVGDGIASGNLTNIYGCLITDNAIGIYLPTGTSAQYFSRVVGNTIHSNTSHGIDLSGALAETVIIKNNQITGNGGYGINAASGQSAVQDEIDYNNFGTGATANTSGARNNLNAGDNDLAVDPGYTATGSDDYSIGTNTKAKGFPLAGTDTIGVNSGTSSYVDIGAAQRQEPAGGGGSQLVNGGLVS